MKKAQNPDYTNIATLLGWLKDGNQRLTTLDNAFALAKSGLRIVNI